MEGKIIKTLAEYITQLHHENSDWFEEYKNDEFDTNGVEQDHEEKSSNKNEYSSS
jgi:deoxyadenosine/deoxycytidine kinase